VAAEAMTGSELMAARQVEAEIAAGAWVREGVLGVTRASERREEGQGAAGMAAVVEAKEARWEAFLEEKGLVEEVSMGQAV